MVEQITTKEFIEKYSGGCETFYVLLNANLDYYGNTCKVGKNNFSIKKDAHGQTFVGGLTFLLKKVDMVHGIINCVEPQIIGKFKLCLDSEIYAISDSLAIIDKFELLEKISLREFISSLSQEEKDYVTKRYIEDVSSNGLRIKDIINEFRTRKVCLAAVKQNGMAIQYLDDLERTLEVCLEAVKQHGYAIQFLSKEQKTKDVWFAAVKQIPEGVRFLSDEKFIKDICIAAVDQRRGAAAIPFIRKLFKDGSEVWAEVGKLEWRTN